MLSPIDDESLHRALYSIEAPTSLAPAEEELRAAFDRIRKIVEPEV
jgi:hypothetical protein